MAEGRSNAAIAAKLFISEKAVSRHAAGIFANLGLARPTTTTAVSWPSSPTWAADPPRPAAGPRLHPQKH